MKTAGMVQPQPHRGGLFIVCASHETLSSVGATWNRDMPPRWGFLRLVVVSYKHAAPTELALERFT